MFHIKIKTQILQLNKLNHYSFNIRSYLWRRYY